MSSLRVTVVVFFFSLSLWNLAAQSDDQAPAAKAPVQRKTKEAAPKKAAAAKKPPASKKKAAGI